MSKRENLIREHALMLAGSLEALFSRGAALLQRGDVLGARGIYVQICELDPDNPDAWFMRGVLSAEAELLSEGISSLRKALQLNPSWVEAHVNLGRLLATIGELDDALALAERATETAPDNVEAWVLLASIQGQRGDFLGAESSSRRALALSPAHAEARFSLADALKGQDDLDGAEKWYRSGLALQPEFAEGWHLLGLTQCLLGRLPEAENSYRRALSLQPQNDEWHKSLGRLLLRQGKHRDALAIYQLLLKRKRDDPDIYLDSAGVLMAIGAHNDAIKHCEHALQIAPSSAQAWFILSLIRSQTNAIPEAISCCRRAVNLKPDYIQAHIHLADMLQAMGELPTAIESYKHALKINSMNPNATAGLARALEKIGAFDEAYSILEPLLREGRVNPQIALAFASLCRHVDRCAESILLLEHFAKQSTNKGDSAYPIRTKQELHQRLGKLLDSEEDYDKAFEHFQRANSLRPTQFNSESHRQFTADIMADYSAARLAQAPSSEIDSAMPIFIIGMPRSGTTLVEQILASHPAVFGGGELQHIPHLAAMLGSDCEGDLIRPPALSVLTKSALRDAAEEYLRRTNALSGAAIRVTDKLPYNFFHLGFISLLFPNAHIVHCLRDSMDTCLSIYFQDFSGYQGYAARLDAIGAFYQQYQILMNHWRRTLAIPVLEVNYEELIRDQEGVSRALVEFCGLEWSERCLEFHKNARTVNTASYDQVRRPLYRSSMGRWRNYERHLGPLRQVLQEPTNPR